jgi:hypothetical protein
MRISSGWMTGCVLAAGLWAVGPVLAQPAVVGNWSKVSHVSDMGGTKMDSHAALLQSRPCAGKIVWRVNADSTFRLDASQSGCDERYVKVQQKLYSETRWKLEGDLLTVSATNFAVGQSYRVALSGDRMTWTGTEGQGVIVYRRLP